MKPRRPRFLQGAKAAQYTLYAVVAIVACAAVVGFGVAFLSIFIWL